MNLEHFWKSVLNQNAEEIKTYFHADAYVNWHCSNEHFTVDEYIKANCEYPGEWDGEIEKICECGNLMITVTHVYTRDKALSFHVVSFFDIKDDQIQALDEYWGDDAPAPQWRLDKHIGKAII